MKTKNFTFPKQSKIKIFLSLVVIVVFSFSGLSQSSSFPIGSDSRFELLSADIENHTEYYHLIEYDGENEKKVWLKIELADIDVPNLNGEKITQRGGHELVEFIINCENKSILEKRRIRVNYMGVVQNVIFKYPYENKASILPNTFYELLRVNVCD